MIHSIKVLFGNDAEDKGRYGARLFTELGFDADCCAQDGAEVLKRIHADEPDVVVMDVYLPRLDAIAVMNGAVKECRKVPKFIITVNTNNPYVNDQLMQNGASYLMLVPFRYEILAERVRSLMCAAVDASHSPQSDAAVQVEITRLLQEFGIPANLKGYHYLRSAIFLSMRDAHMLQAVTGLLYPTVAKQHATTPTRVERAIRHAIEIAWNRGNREAFKPCFGYQVNVLERKPTNSEFIAALTDYLFLSYRTDARQA